MKTLKAKMYIWMGVWGGILLLGLIFLFAVNRKPYAEKEFLRQVVVNTNSLLLASDKGVRVYELDRAEAIKFSFDQITKSINYLFVAAGALLGLIVKITVEPLLDPSKKSVLSDRSILLLWNGAMACFSSLFFGVVAYEYFPEIATTKIFSIYGDLAQAVGLQAAAFIIAGILSLVVLPDFFTAGRQQSN
jgi:hypothetical protein